MDNIKVLRVRDVKLPERGTSLSAGIDFSFQMISKKQHCCHIQIYLFRAEYALAFQKILC